MPVGDDPILICCAEVALRPCVHRSPDGPADVLGIQAHEMNICVVERVIGLGPGSQAAGLRAFGHRENVVVGPGLCRGTRAAGVVISDRGPQHRFSQHGRVRIRRPENRVSKFAIRTAVISIIAQHQPQISVPGSSVRIVRVADGFLIAVIRSRIPQNPNPGRLRGSRRRRRQDKMVRVISGKRCGRSPHGIIDG